MNGPKRMREDASPELRRILGSSSMDEPPPGAMNKTLKRIGLAGAASVAVTAVAGSAAAKTASPAVSAGIIGLLKWGAVGAIVGGLGIGTVKVVSTMNAEEQEPPAPSSSAPRVAPPRGVEALPVTPSPSATASASAAPGATARPAPSSTDSAPRPASSASSLTLEMQELEAVRSAIAQGRGAEAIGLLDGFAARYPKARLSEEAAVLRIEALRASGASGQAQSMAEEFLRTHPNSAFGDRVRSLQAR